MYTKKANELLQRSQLRTFCTHDLCKFIQMKYKMSVNIVGAKVPLFSVVWISLFRIYSAFLRQDFAIGCKVIK